MKLLIAILCLAFICLTGCSETTTETIESEVTERLYYDDGRFLGVSTKEDVFIYDEIYDETLSTRYINKPKIPLDEYKIGDTIHYKKTTTKRIRTDNILDKVHDTISIMKNNSYQPIKKGDAEIINVTYEFLE